MDLALSEEYQALQAEIRAFIATHGHKSPKVGGGRKRPDQKTLDWQKLLVEHGYAGRTIPQEYPPRHFQTDADPRRLCLGPGDRTDRRFREKTGKARLRRVDHGI